MRAFGLFALLLLTAFSGKTVADDLLPRTVVAIWDSKESKDIYFTKIHQMAETPLNYLGVKLEYWDVREKLPDLRGRKEVLGILVWFPRYYAFHKGSDFFSWACDQLDAGIKIVLLGEFGSENLDKESVKRFWRKLGVDDGEEWVNDTHAVEFVKVDREIVEFERKYIDVLPPFLILRGVDDQLKEHLKVRIKDKEKEKEAVLVATSARGGIALGGYEIFESGDEESGYFRQWYLNPFRFFKTAFDLKDYPVPDTTTMAGSRIYYSHIDGDGFNEYVEIEEYRREKTIAAEVILREIIRKNNDLPVTVGPIVAEINPQWSGSPKSGKIAAEILAEPNVEAGSHTYTHPFDWLFFENYSKEDEEAVRKGSSFSSFVGQLFGRREKSTVKRDERYDLPRPYFKEPFDINMEIQGSIDAINDLSPPDKRVQILQWSGNCLPFEKAVRLCREAGVCNINGGDTRFDDEYLSYSWVGPLGRMVGKERQIYSSSSNENTYTDLWRDRFWAFVFLIQTLENTDCPIRLKPINLYYHMYSGSKVASLNAVKQILRYIRGEEILPVTTSLFSAVVDGFYTAEITRLADGGWKIRQRGKLQTIRFDNASLTSVDFTKSKGVIGQRHLHGSLYVALDEAVKEPLIYLKEVEEFGKEPMSGKIYLVKSSWRMWEVSAGEKEVSFAAMGFGSGDMRWRVPHNGHYKITLTNEAGEMSELSAEAKDSELKVRLPQERKRVFVNIKAEI